MDLLRKLFGGGGRAQGGDANGLYYYVQPHGCAEVIRVRIDRANDLSESDEGGYYVRKVARGSHYKCLREVEIELFFNAQRQLSHSELRGGQLVSEAEYTAWQAQQTPPEASA